MPGGSLAALGTEIAGCRACPRLVAWRESAAADPPARFRGTTYWARPVPGFGDPTARMLLLGLAPAKDGGNRTGRVFTGDRSGDFLFAALHRAGLANQPSSTGLQDGLILRDTYIAAAVRCAPPANRPLPAERDRCAPVPPPRARRCWRTCGSSSPSARMPGRRRCERSRRRGGPWRTRFRGSPTPPRASPARYRLLGAYHPSQQNTFTGRLTPAMLDAVLERAVELAARLTTGRPISRPALAVPGTGPTSSVSLGRSALDRVTTGPCGYRCCTHIYSS